MAGFVGEIDHLRRPLEAQAPAATSDGRNTFPEKLQSVIEARNKRIASALSLTHNEPNDKGRTRIQQERDRLGKLSRDSRNPKNNPYVVGEDVWIPAETPVGLTLGESYITGMPLQGTLTNVSGGYGGGGYLEKSDQLIEPLFRVSVQLPRVEGQEHAEAVTLLVPNDLLTHAVPQGQGMANAIELTTAA